MDPGPAARLMLVAAIALLGCVSMPAAASQPKVHTIEPDGSMRQANERPSLAKCLARKGFVFYGASWCPYCAQQIRLFGEDAENLPYVECSADGSRDGADTPVCAKLGIRSYPMWIFPNGRRDSGVKSLEKLGRLSGCPIGP